MFGLVVAMFAARQPASCKRQFQLLWKNSLQTAKDEAVCLLLRVVQMAEADAERERENEKKRGGGEARGLNSRTGSLETSDGKFK
jgi:hypothetical protein